MSMKFARQHYFATRHFKKQIILEIASCMESRDHDSRRKCDISLFGELESFLAIELHAERFEWYREDLTVVI